MQLWNYFCYCVKLLQYIVSCTCLLVATVTITVGVINGYGTIHSAYPILDFCFIIAAFIGLAANEGYQVAALRIQNVELMSELIDGSYPRAKAVYDLLYGSKIYNDDAHKSAPSIISNNGMQRLFIGQSFMVVFCSFTIANLTTFPSLPPLFLGSHQINDTFVTIFLRSGLPGVFFTFTMVQVLPSILAKEHSVKFLNIPGIYSMIRFALLIEQMGIVQFVYILVESAGALFCKSYSVCINERNQSIL